MEVFTRLSGAPPLFTRAPACAAPRRCHPLPCNSSRRCTAMQTSAAPVTHPVWPPFGSLQTKGCEDGLSSVSQRRHYSRAGGMRHPRARRASTDPDVLNRKGVWALERRTYRRGLLQLLLQHKTRAAAFAAIASALPHCIHVLSLPGPFTLFVPVDTGFEFSLSPNSLRKVAARLQLLAASDPATAASLQCYAFPAFPRHLEHPEMETLLQQQRQLTPAAAAAAAEAAREKLALLIKAHIVPGALPLKRILTHPSQDPAEADAAAADSSAAAGSAAVTELHALLGGAGAGAFAVGPSLGGDLLRIRKEVSLATAAAALRTGSSNISPIVLQQHQRQQQPQKQQQQLGQGLFRVYVEGARLLQGDLRAANGIVHFIDRPIIPSALLLEIKAYGAGCKSPCVLQSICPPLSLQWGRLLLERARPYTPNKDWRSWRSSLSSSSLSGIELFGWEKGKGLALYSAFMASTKVYEIGTSVQGQSKFEGKQLSPRWKVSHFFQKATGFSASGVQELLRGADSGPIAQFIDHGAIADFSLWSPSRNCVRGPGRGVVLACAASSASAFVRLLLITKGVKRSDLTRAIHFGVWASRRLAAAAGFPRVYTMAGVSPLWSPSVLSSSSSLARPS
ncbi:uncharacterized protein LOC34618009 [Cyclospora cayetanensis]|uniref:Uncharacterized protein LOC34618009 n=1 Tax=Cyclospora cayetanensis TaxID=88456 RepID=A0A6P5WDV3_9EIME|nr:uncharacterized protein LOC34618009 [Cyclospora cayetanensis]